MVEEQTADTKKLAVIYTRVSSDKQIQEGTGLETQETLCREKAEQLGYTILKVFSDGGISGKDLENRPGVLNLLDFLKNSKDSITIFTYDTDRLSRDTGDFIKIRSIIHTNNHMLITIKNGLIGQDSTSNLISTVISAVGQCEREKNAERSKTNMKTIVSEGYWLFKEPIGLKKCMEKKSDKYRWLIRKEPEASIIQEALEKFATAELQTQTDVANFLKTKFEFHDIKKRNWFDLAKRILTEEKYSGYFEYKPWGVPYQKGKIEALITPETFKIIQQRLKGKERVKHTIYNKNDERFPLRGLILCPYCGKPITGSLTKGGTFPYYQCQNRHCAGKRLVNVKPSLLHADFESLLKNITPSDDFINTAKTQALSIYQACYDNIKNDNKLKKFRINQIDNEIDNCFEKYKNTSSSIFIQKLEEQVNKLESEKQHIEAELNNSTNIEIMPFDEAFTYVEEFIKNPLKLWQQSDIFMKRQIYKLTFEEKLSYDKQNKFSEPKLSPIFKMIHNVKFDGIIITPDFFRHLVPNLEISDKKFVQDNLKSGTIVFPQIIKDYRKKVVGNSYVVP